MNTSINEDSNLSDSRVFMLRFWLEDLGNEQKEWRGKVQYIYSGEVIYFRDWSVLETFVEGFLSGCIGQDVRPNLRDKPSKGLYQKKGKIC